MHAARKIAVTVAVFLALPIGVARASTKADLCTTTANVAEAAYQAHANGVPRSDVEAKVLAMINKESFPADKYRNIKKLLFAQVGMEYALPPVSVLGAQETHKRIHTVTYLECMGR